VIVHNDYTINRPLNATVFHGIILNLQKPANEFAATSTQSLPLQAKLALKSILIRQWMVFVRLWGQLMLAGRMIGPEVNGPGSFE
jgi:hypothetical protein